MSATTAIPTTTRVATYPGVSGRLMGPLRAREGVDAYLAAGGYAPIADAAALVDVVEAAGLRGRGGAAFPLATKIRAVASGAGRPVVVANGEEGEPASVKDRWLLRFRPHLVLDGLRIAAAMVGSEDLHVYLSDPESASSMQIALRELSTSHAWGARIQITVVDPSYVAGEETAVVRAINGGPALPMDKPPRPFEEGVDSRPTLISNVETLANLPLICRLGADGYRELGVESAPGSFLLTLTGRTVLGLFEVPLGVTLREVLDWLGADTADIQGVLMGGYFSGVLGNRALDTPLDYDSFRTIGGALGCGAVAVLDSTTCPVDVSAGVMSYFAENNAGQCGSCFNGTAAMAAVLEALREGRAEQGDIDRLRTWSVQLRGRGACGTLDGATNIAASLLREFPGLVGSHLAGGCEQCGSGGTMTNPPFVIGLPSDPWDQRPS